MIPLRTLVALGAPAFLAGTLGVTNAHARTHFIHPSNRPAILGVAGTTRIYALAGDGEVTSGLAYKSLSSDWTLLANPSGVSQFWTSTGVSAVMTPSGARIYAISYGQGQTPSQLYEYAVDQSGSGSWRALGLPSGSNFSNGVQIAAAYDVSSDRTWVGVRSAYNGIATDGHVFTCTFRAAGPCAWEDESCRGSPSCASPEIASTLSPIAVDPTPLDGQQAAVYMVRPDGHLLRYRWAVNDWDDLEMPSGAVVDFTGIQARTEDGTTRVVTATWDQVSWGDRLQARRSTGGTSWSPWADLSAGGPAEGLSFDLNNVFMVPAFGIGPRRIWAVGLQMSPEINVLWSCDWDDSACLWTLHGRPADQRPYYDGLGGGISGTSSRAYVTGSVGGVPQYVYAWDQNAPRWENHLAPRDGSIELPSDPGQNLGEFAAAEWGGNVVVAGMSSLPAGGNVVAWQSTDDGSAWSDVMRPFGPDDTMSPRTDPSVTFGADNRAYVIAVGFPFVLGLGFSLRGVRWTPTPSPAWGAPIVLPVAQLGVRDRPWSVADTLRPGALHVVYVGGGTSGVATLRWTYCVGASDCVGATPAWCPPSGAGFEVTVPGGAPASRTGCAADRFEGAPADGSYGGSPGCMSAQGGDGQLWIAVQDDRDCNSPPGTYPQLYQGPGTAMGDRTRGIGVRTVSYPSWPACAPPTLGGAECIYYTEPHVAQLASAPAMSIGPASTRHFAVNLSAARDTSGRIAITIQGYRALATGDACLPSSGACRADVLFAYRDPATGRWCGNDCELPGNVNVGTMLVVNDDPIGSGQRDHVLGHVAPLDQGYFAGAWMDYADSPTDSVYALRSSFFRTTSMVPIESGWPSTPPGTFTPASARYLDVYVHAGARLRSHFVHALSETSGGRSVPRAMLQSPWTIAP